MTLFEFPDQFFGAELPQVVGCAAGSIVGHGLTAARADLTHQLGSREAEGRGRKGEEGSRYSTGAESIETALTKFTGCTTVSIGPSGRSLATCIWREKPSGSTCSHQCTLQLTVREPAGSILLSRAVAGLLEQDPTASAVVILQRLRPLGYDGGITILRTCVSQLRSPLHPPGAFVRMEPAPAERFEVDWGNFGALNYAGDKRKLYAFCLIDGHSRMLSVEFTHSQSFATFVRCHLHAFQALGGVARECCYENL